MIMKNIRHILTAAALIVLAFPARAQQDPQFSQYMFNPMVLNPAYAGSRGVLNGSIVLRQQWVGFGDGAPSTEVFSVNSPTRKGKMGLGLQIMADQIGPKKSSGITLDYAYRIPLGKGKLAFGLSAGMLNYRVNWDLVDYKDQTDQYASMGQTNKTFPNFDFGIFYNTKSFFTGVSVTHLNHGIYGVTNDSTGTYAYLRSHAFFTIGKAWKVSDNVLFSPSIIVKSVAGISIPSTDINLNFQIKNMLWLGTSLRTDKSLIFLAQYNITDKFKVGYSYDMTLGRLKSYQSGSHEIYLGFDLNFFKSQTLSPRYF